MNAASSTFEVARLVEYEVRDFESKKRFLAFRERLLKAFISFPISLFEGFVARQVNQVANRFASHAVWFRGARQWITDREPVEPFDADFVVARQLDVIVADIQRLRAVTEELAGKKQVDSSSPSPVIAALLRVVEAATTLQHEVRDFQAALFVHEGNAGLLGAAGAHKYLASLDPVFAEVQRSTVRIEHRISSLAAIGSDDEYDEEMLVEARRVLSAVKSKPLVG